jgi:hypothetical protein
MKQKHFINIQHKGIPDRLSRWSYQKQNDGTIKWNIDTYVDGYYKANASRSGIDNFWDFERNIESIRCLSPDVFEVMEYSL